MNILVCTKLSIPATKRYIPHWPDYRGEHEIRLNTWLCSHASDPDIILCMGVGAMVETYKALEQHPSAKLFVYNWDCYEWVWKNPRPGEYNYIRFGELCKKAEMVFTPSECTALRTKQWWGIDKVHTILSCCPKWDSTPNISNGDYVLCCLREIPDKKWDQLEKACKETNLRLVMTKHEAHYEDYKDLIANCRFIVSHLDELSTGGLSLLEAYRIGKPVLLSDSHWHGGSDYFGHRAIYFRYNDFEYLKYRLLQLHLAPQIGKRTDMKSWVEENYSDFHMASELVHCMETVCNE